MGRRVDLEGMQVPATALTWSRMSTSRVSISKKVGSGLSGRKGTHSKWSSLLHTARYWVRSISARTV